MLDDQQASGQKIALDVSKGVLEFEAVIVDNKNGNVGEPVSLKEKLFLPVVADDTELFGLTEEICTFVMWRD